MPISTAQATTMIMNIWDTYDKDKSGCLDRSEAQKLFGDLFASDGVTVTPEQLDTIIEAIDTNGDGAISKQEMINLLTEYL